VLAVLASACRWNFGQQPDPVDVGAGTDTLIADTTVDMLVGHDEDGDGVLDTDDFCPHVPDTANLDGDGDRVGDVCDANPTLATETWLVFAPMTAPMVPTFANDMEWTPRVDDWQYNDAAGPAQLIRNGVVANIDIWMGFDVLTVGTGGVQAAIVINGTTPYWYGEIFDGGGGNASLNITEYTGSNYVARSAVSMGAVFPVGPVEMHLSARPGGMFRVEANGSVSSAPIAAYDGDQFIHIGFGNHTGRLRYLALIESQ
jgi:hypothetical protein